MSEKWGTRGGADCHCDCDGYRPDTLGGDYGSCSSRTGYAAVKLNSPDPSYSKQGNQATEYE